ncbi:hypothetical protein JMUB898_1010 [Staphylococcus caprae]|nr:hypothetical protein JMUB898_1010 [Staphylococcus caprae]
MVTIAVNIANIGVRLSNIQNTVVRKVARPVLIVLAPIICLYHFTFILI